MACAGIQTDVKECNHAEVHATVTYLPKWRSYCCTAEKCSGQWTESFWTTNWFLYAIVLQHLYFYWHDLQVGEKTFHHASPTIMHHAWLTVCCLGADYNLTHGTVDAGVEYAETLECQTPDGCHSRCWVLLANTRIYRSSGPYNALS